MASSIKSPFAAKPGRSYDLPHPRRERPQSPGAARCNITSTVDDPAHPDSVWITINQLDDMRDAWARANLASGTLRSTEAGYDFPLPRRSR